MGGMREIVAVVVAADSPAGRVATAIDDITAHLPPPDVPWECPLCSAHSWPCSRFDAAARRVMATGVRLADLVPLDLHPRLWPRTPPPQPAASPAPELGRPTD
jgi:hypothetical protein